MIPIYPDIAGNASDAQMNISTGEDTPLDANIGLTPENVSAQIEIGGEGTSEMDTLVPPDEHKTVLLSSGIAIETTTTTENT